MVLSVIKFFLCVDFFFSRLEGRIHGTKGSIDGQTSTRARVAWRQAVRRVGPGGLMNDRTLRAGLVHKDASVFFNNCITADSARVFFFLLDDKIGELVAFPCVRSTRSKTLRCSLIKPESTWRLNPGSFMKVRSRRSSEYQGLFSSCRTVLPVSDGASASICLAARSPDSMAPSTQPVFMVVKSPAK